LNDNEIQSRIDWLLDEIAPLTQNCNLGVYPHAYDPEVDTLYLDVTPRIQSKWFETAYQFAKHENMKYDRSYKIYGIDGQPRVSYSGLVWVRYLSPFEDGSNVGLNIWSQQPSHVDVEAQLGLYYSLWKERHDMEPIDVLQKFIG
jgi:hypothetical protein